MRFHRLGLTFDYPDNWSVDMTDGEGRHAAVTVYAPGGGFWSVSAHAAGGADPDSLVEAVVAEMKSEYSELDSEATTEEVQGLTLRGNDMNFYCLDLTNTARIRTLVTSDTIYVVFCQAEDREWDDIAPVFQAMTTSLVRGLV